MVNSTVPTESATNSSDAFDSKINTWAEGILLSIDADGSKLKIRGAKRPYASEYAKMLKKIHNQTAKMPQPDRARQALEIRLDWKNALEKARNMGMQKDADLTFQLPGKNGALVVVDETTFYNRDQQYSNPDASLARLTNNEIKAVQALKDLKIGDCVAVGYDSAVLNDTAYVVIKANQEMPE